MNDITQIMICGSAVWAGNLFGIWHMTEEVRSGRRRNCWSDLWQYPVVLLIWTALGFCLASL